MAHSGPQSWEMLCPVCKTFIETKNENGVQSSLDYHFLSEHPTLRNIDVSQSNNQMFVLDTMNGDRVHHQSKECTSYIICPVCDSVVEIFENSINHYFMEHFEMYHQNVTKPYSSSALAVGKSGLYTDKHEISVEENHDNLSNLQSMSSKSQSYKFFELAPELEKHSGYIILNGDDFLCHICRETLDTQKTIEEHLKTKRHEDNVIGWLKDKLSIHMHTVMEFVSFYGSNLCCNLCRCNIDLSSTNPHETLVNIISHNASDKHSKTKFHGYTRKSHDGYTIPKSVTDKNPLINEHRKFIEIEMKPCFKCTLCNETINLIENDNKLDQIFLTHITSVLHTKNVQAMSVLRCFKEVNGIRDGNHSSFVSNGFINCTQCKCTIAPDPEQLFEHNFYSQGHVNVETSKLSENRNKEHAPLTSEKCQSSKNKSSNSSSSKISSLEITSTSPNSQLNSSEAVHPKVSKTKEIKKPNVKEILRPLYSQFGNITCIAENEHGNLTCLICNCSVQPSTHCVKMHIMGKFHKNNIQCQIKEFHSLKLNNDETQQELNLNKGETHRERNIDLIDHLFQSLPQRYQEVKAYFSVNLSDGSVNCALCDCVIDPILLKAHLQEDAHVHQNQLKRD